MVMYKNKGSFRNSRIGRVPDRGGRITDDKCEGKKITPTFKSVCEWMMGKWMDNW